MKRVVAIISLLLCITLAFSSCSISDAPKTISQIVSNVSESISTQEYLDENYNGRKNYYYSSLSKSQKAEYTKIYNAYMKQETFTINVQHDEIEYLFNCVLYDNPEIFWVDSKYAYSQSANCYYIEPIYRFTPEEAEEMTEKINYQISRIVASAGSKKSVYDKEKYFHDYICENTIYDMSTYEGIGDTVYSLLFDGRAICEGYARTMKMLLDAIGVYNYLVTGNTKNDDGAIEGHMWNVVEVADNEFYHIDVTWDDDDNGDIGEKYYLYFNVTDEDISKDHFDVMPSKNNCTSRRYNYYSVNGVFFSSFDNFKGMAIPCANSITDDLIVEMRFENNIDYYTAVQKIENHQYDNALFEFTSDIARISGRHIVSTSYICDDDLYYICIVFERGWLDG